MEVTPTVKFVNPIVAHIYQPFEGNEFFERNDFSAFVQQTDTLSGKFDMTKMDVTIIFTPKDSSGNEDV